MYWTDNFNDTIQRANLDGSGVETLYTAADGLNFPYGIALDAPPPPSNLRVYVKRPAGWGLPHVQITSTTPNVGTSTAPGEPMVAEGCGWYSYRFQGAQSATFSFNGHPADPLPETVPLTRDRKAFFVPDAPGGGALTGTWHLRNPDAACTDRVLVSVKALLQGPYDTGTGQMTTALHDAGLLPMAHPFTDPLFDDSPKAYSGPETSALVDPAATLRLTDWLLVELRTTAGDPTTTQAAQAGLSLASVRSILNTGGSESMAFKVPDGSYHVVVRARNHLSVIGHPVALSAIPTGYNFTTAGTQALGTNPMVEVEADVWALWGGDGTGDDNVSAFDFLNVWLPQNGGAPGYHAGDFNLTGDVTAFDFLQVWLPANGQSSQVVD